MTIFLIFHEEILEHFFFLICGAFHLRPLLLGVALSTGPGLEAGSIHSVLIIAFVDRERQFSFVSLRLLVVVLSPSVWQMCVACISFFLCS